MKTSLRKRVIVKTIIPTLIILISGFIVMRGKPDILAKTVSIIDIVIFLSSFIYTRRKKFELNDEMTRSNQLKAANVTYVIILSAVGLVMSYGLYYRTSVTISMIELVLIFVGMYILNSILFLFFDIRGN
ncbi:hypothetical protein [Desulfosporosinus sp. FKB]|uniref:hypothetical protein n=1 Tax=Desulfosporosinus sp. FKB TaxID=1969835 RepID=UPI000B4A5226|nr:hypothetical protein [Desulfosporosinus sp. FKB]